MKLNNTDKLPFDIYRVTNRIYLFLFNDSYDMCMHFLRYQETYESPKFRNQKFTILEFMAWYAKNYGKGVFTYTGDWGGFNIPSNVIWKVHASKIDDYNAYDAAMIAAYNKISSITHLEPDGVAHDTFYVLGVTKQDADLLSHELAHGLYATTAAYREAMTSCQKDLPTSVKNDVFDYLKDIGYCDDVLDDELQAYFSTGLTPPIEKFEKYTLSFQKTYEKFTKHIDFNLKTAIPLQFK
jgi:hypothetical protein